MFNVRSSREKIPLNRASCSISRNNTQQTWYIQYNFKSPALFHFTSFLQFVYSTMSLFCSGNNNKKSPFAVDNKKIQVKEREGETRRGAFTISLARLHVFLVCLFLFLFLRESSFLPLTLSQSRDSTLILASSSFNS